MNEGYRRLLLALGLALSLVMGCGDDSDDTTTTETDVVESGELPFYGECQSKADCYAGDAVPSTPCFEFACEPAEEGEGNVCAEVARAVNSPCTSDTCEADGACTQCGCDGAGACVAQAAFDGTVCGEVNGCGGSYCKAGECLAEEKDCDDNNPCTTDSCAEGDCVYEAVAGDCDDGDSCTSGDTCSDGVCSGEADICTCEEDADCPAPADLCMGTYACVEGLCEIQEGSAQLCLTDNPCEVGSCDAATGECTFTPVADGETCDDGVSCTTGDICVAGVCTGEEGTVEICDDGVDNNCDEIADCDDETCAGDPACPVEEVSFCDQWAETCGEWTMETTCADWWANAAPGTEGDSTGATQACYWYHLNVAIEQETEEATAEHCMHAAGAAPCVDETTEEEGGEEGGEETGIVFSGTFGGAVISGTTYSTPTGAERWAGFANEDSSIYPFSFANGGTITFTGASDAPVSLYFKFEKNAFPDTEPSFGTESITVDGAAMEYTVEIPAQDAANTYSSFLLYVTTLDQGVTLTNVQVTENEATEEGGEATEEGGEATEEGGEAAEEGGEAAEEGGEAAEEGGEAAEEGGEGGEDTGIVFSGVFGGTIADGNTYTFPTGAEEWAGFANEDTTLFPFSFPNGGTVTFTGASDAPVTLQFKFEKAAFPDVEPSFFCDAVTVDGEATEYTVTIPAQDAANSYASFLLYLQTKDTPVTLTNVVVTANEATGEEGGEATEEGGEATEEGGEAAEEGGEAAEEGGEGGEDTGIVFSGVFGGTIADGNTYTFPTGAEEWAGFANEDATLFPFSFPNGGTVTFTGSSDAPVTLQFKFEKAAFPDVEPSFFCDAVTVEGAEAEYTVNIPAQDAANTYASFLLYLQTKDTAVTLTNVVVTAN